MLKVADTQNEIEFVKMHSATLLFQYCPETRYFNSLPKLVDPSTALSNKKTLFQKRYLKILRQTCRPRPAQVAFKYLFIQSSAIHDTYRISLRSSSLREPRDPLPKVVFSI